MQVQPLEQGSLSARAYYTLRDALIAGNFRPGQRLVMQELAEALGTSVTPVREACLRLISERGLELRSGRFVAVPELTLARYMEIRTIRIALEGLAAELACARVAESDVARVTEIHARFAAAERAGEKETAIQANRDFHFAVYKLSGMDMLVAQIESLWISMGPILNVYYRDVATDYVGADEHLRLIGALRARDRAAARAAIERDILRGGESIIAHLTERQAGVGA